MPEHFHLMKTPILEQPTETMRLYVTHIPLQILRVQYCSLTRVVAKHGRAESTTHTFVSLLVGYGQLQEASPFHQQTGWKEQLNLDLYG
jgi:hypothetical protein